MSIAMAKLRLLASSTLLVGTLVGGLTFATVSSVSAPSAEAADKCQHTTFKTEMVKAACEKGGQKEAKAVMKTWMKEKKVKSCNQCHSKLAPTYDLKPDAVEQFKKLGGAVLADSGKTAPAKPVATAKAPSTAKAPPAKAPAPAK